MSNLICSTMSCCKNCITYYSRSVYVQTHCLFWFANQNIMIDARRRGCHGLPKLQTCLSNLERHSKHGVHSKILTEAL